MSQPNQQQLEHEAKERFVNEYFDSFTVEKKFEILQNGLGASFVEGDFRDWCDELANKFRD